MYGLSAAATTWLDLGDPTGNTDYRLCVYDGEPTLVANLHVWGGSTYNVRPCWSAEANGFSYRCPGILPSGVSRLAIQIGNTGNARIGLKTKGAHVPVPTLPLAQEAGPVVVQLINNSTTTCWEATYRAPPNSDPLRTTKWVDRPD